MKSSTVGNGRTDTASDNHDDMPVTSMRSVMKLENQTLDKSRDKGGKFG